MGNRSLEIFQAPSDVRRVIALEEARLCESLVLLNSRPGKPCPTGFRDDGVESTFLLTRQCFLNGVVCRQLQKLETSYVDVFDSTVILVEPSAMTEWSIERGRFWYSTHRLDGGKWEPKDPRFVKWAESLLRLVRSKSIYKVAYSPYKYWFAQDADRWLDARDGVWDAQSKFWSAEVQGPFRSSQPAARTLTTGRT